MAQITQTRMSATEYLKLPETKTPTQLIDGEIIVSPAPEIPHQDVVFTAARLLDSLQLGGKVRISPIDLWLDEENVVQPDVLWMANDSWCKVAED